jgi:GTPase SAR1 family protein
MKHDLKVAIIGSVSVGKSTFINALYAKNLSDCKRIRSTMVPQHYKESALVMTMDVEKIKTSNNESNNNKEAVDKINEIVHEVPINKYHLKKQNRNDYLLHLYDIPGLDDSKTKDLYFKWVTDNFHQFDIVIYILDIERGFNTDGEISILNLIASLSQKHYEESGKFTLIIPLANKCDDVEITNDGKYHFMDEELGGMYDVISKTLSEVKDKHKLGDRLKPLMPISSEDIFIYRCIQEDGIGIIESFVSKDSKDSKDSKYFNKIGINEFGKRRWSQIDNKAEKIKEYFKKNSVDQLIDKTTTYGKFTMYLNSYLSKYRSDFFMNPYKINKVVLTGKPISDAITLALNTLNEYYELEKKGIVTSAELLINDITTEITQYFKKFTNLTQILLSNKSIDHILMNYSSINGENKYWHKLYKQNLTELQSNIDKITVSEFGELLINWNLAEIIPLLQNTDKIIQCLIEFSSGNHTSASVNKYYEIVFGTDQPILIVMNLQESIKLKLLDSFLKTMVKYHIMNIPSYFLIYIKIYVDRYLSDIYRAYFTLKLDHLMHICYVKNDVAKIEYPTDDNLKDLVSYFFN